MTPSGDQGVTAHHLVVGIDGGATRTRYLLADASGAILGRREGKGSLLRAGGDLAVADELTEQLGRLAADAGRDPPVGALCAGLAGASGRSGARLALEARLRESGVAHRLSVVSDADIAFVDAFGDGGGILMIAGTGSVALGRSGPGELERAGGWGALLGDEGSGYWLGLEGIRAAIRAAEGREAETRLTGEVLSELGLASVVDTLTWSDGATKAEIAALAPRVVALADEGDPVAGSIVDRGVTWLTGHAEALRGRLGPSAGVTGAGPAEGMWSPAVALVGGLVEPGGLLRSRVTVALEAAGFAVHGDLVEPARGAVTMALDL